MSYFRPVKLTFPHKPRKAVLTVLAIFCYIAWRVRYYLMSVIPLLGTQTYCKCGRIWKFMTQSCKALWGRTEITPRCCLVAAKVRILAIKPMAKNPLVCCNKAFIKQLRFQKMLNKPQTFQHTFFSSNSAFRDPNSCWHSSRGDIFCSICSTWWRRVLFSLKWTKTI